jgi:hypothetical protein
MMVLMIVRMAEVRHISVRAGNRDRLRMSMPMSYGMAEAVRRERIRSVRECAARSRSAQNPTGRAAPRIVHMLLLPPQASPIAAASDVTDLILVKVCMWTRIYARKIAFDNEHERLSRAPVRTHAVVQVVHGHNLARDRVNLFCLPDERRVCQRQGRRLAKCIRPNRRERCRRRCRDCQRRPEK